MRQTYFAELETIVINAKVVCVSNRKVPSLPELGARSAEMPTGMNQLTALLGLAQAAFGDTFDYLPELQRVGTDQSI